MTRLEKIRKQIGDENKARLKDIAFKNMKISGSRKVSFWKAFNIFRKE